MKTEINNAHDLQSIVSNWVNTFNFVQVEVLEKMAESEGGSLFEYIRQLEPDWDEFLNNYSLHDEYKEYLEENELEDDEDTKREFCENHHQFDSFRDGEQDRNYPMWNTCFEFKNNESEDVIQAAINAGFGIIEGLEPFNTILFVSGAGYSFYGAHWIPLYLNLPWNQDVKKQVEDLQIKYDNL